MNDLITAPDQIVDDIRATFPNFLEGFRRAKRIIDSIGSFEDVELYLLKGQGLAPSSYRTYMVAVRQLYEHTGGLNPFQVTPNHIEDFYDAMLRRCDRATVYNKIMGLKRFFNGSRPLVRFSPALELISTVPVGGLNILALRFMVSPGE